MTRPGFLLVALLLAGLLPATGCVREIRPERVANHRRVPTPNGPASIGGSADVVAGSRAEADASSILATDLLGTWVYDHGLWMERVAAELSGELRARGTLVAPGARPRIEVADVEVEADPSEVERVAWARVQVRLAGPVDLEATGEGRSPLGLRRAVAHALDRAVLELLGTGELGEACRSGHPPWIPRAVPASRSSSPDDEG